MEAKSRSEIDKELEQAWQAEVDHNPAAAVAIYRQALADLETYRRSAAPEDQESLTRFFFFCLLFLLFLNVYLLL